MPRELRFLVIAEGQFGPLTSKTANSCIRYTPERVVAVIDSRRAGRTSQDVLGFGGDIPVVSTVAEGLAAEADGAADRCRAAGREAAGRVARHDSRGDRCRARCVERAAHLHRRGSGVRCARGEAEGRDPRSAPPAARSAGGDGSRAQGRLDRRAHGRHRLQHREDDVGAADS